MIKDIFYKVIYNKETLTEKYQRTKYVKQLVANIFNNVLEK